MTKKGKHRLTDYERLLCRLPVSYRPALRMEKIHFHNRPATIAKTTYMYEESDYQPSSMLLEMFGWSDSKHGFAFWQKCHELLVARESAELKRLQRKSAKTEKLNRLLKKQIENEAH